MPTYKLHYFDIRARAEVARMMFAHGDIKYEDIRHSGEEWAKFKPKTPFGQMPLLEVDGKMLAQSAAINEYVAKQANLLGKDDFQAATIKMLCDQGEDMLKPLIDIFSEKDETKKEELTKKFGEEQMPKSMEDFEKWLANNKSAGYCVGDKMSMADIRLACDITWFDIFGIKLDLNKYPHFKSVVENVNSDPKIAAWIKKRPESKF